MASAITWNLMTYRGDRISRRVVVSSDGTPIDFTGYAVRSQVRAGKTEGATLVLDLSSYFTAGSGGVIQLSVPDAVMNGIAVGRYYWSVVLSVGGQDTTYFVGEFAVIQHPTGNS